MRSGVRGRPARSIVRSAVSAETGRSETSFDVVPLDENVESFPALRGLSVEAARVGEEDGGYFSFSLPGRIAPAPHGRPGGGSV